MYENPINLIVQDIERKTVQEFEQMILKAIRKCGVNVDKDELIKALTYDRNQYSKGYNDGVDDALDKIKADIENHCGLVKEDHCKYCSYCNNVMGVREILEIIDKYKAEKWGRRVNYELSYKEKHNLNESDLTEAQRTLHFIAENMRMEKSISEEGYKHFQQAIKALEQELCEDAISRQAVLGYIHNDLGLGDEENGKDLERQTELEGFYRYVKSLPSVNPQPKIGRWIYDDEHSGWSNLTYTCSCCKREIIVRYEAKDDVYKDYPYCHCGAKMEAEE